MKIEDLSIKEIVRKVKSELINAEEEMTANNEIPLFKVKKLSVELNFIINQSETKDGGLDLKVVSASTGKNYSEGEVQKITLEWEGIDSVNPAKSDVGYFEKTDYSGSNKKFSGGLLFAKPDGSISIIDSKIKPYISTVIKKGSK